MIKLQHLLVNAPVLSTPNLKYNMCLATDSSAFGIGAALYQVIHNKVYYIGFVARRLAPSETRWGSSKRELAAVAYAFQRFHQWLYGRHFHLFVDNTGILYLHSKEKINRMVENFYETIFEMDFDITYCMGMKNILADQLSRIFWPNSLVEGSNQKVAVKQKINEQKNSKLEMKGTSESKEFNKKQISVMNKNLLKSIDLNEIRKMNIKRKEKQNTNERKFKKIKIDETDINKIPNDFKKRINEEVNNNIQKGIGKNTNNNQNKNVSRDVQKGKQKDRKICNVARIKRKIKQLNQNKVKLFSKVTHKKRNEKHLPEIKIKEKSREANILKYMKEEESHKKEELKEKGVQESRGIMKENTINPKEFGEMDKLNKNANSETNAEAEKDTKLDSSGESVNGNTEISSLNIPHMENDIYISDSGKELNINIDKDKLDINSQEIIYINDTISDNTSPHNNNNSLNITNLYMCVSHLNLYQTPKDDEEKQNILEKSHILGHFGIHAMETIIHQDLNYHWKGLREDITDYIRKCHKCQKFNLAKHVYHPPKQEAPGGIMDHVVFDLGTFDCTTPRGNNYILVVLDLFSRFIILRAIPDKTAVTVAKELVSIFSLFGYPCIVGHDRGQEFNSILLENILKHAELRIERAYHSHLRETVVVKLR